METLNEKVPTGTVNGIYDHRFAGVVDVFTRNFVEQGEVGASVCMTLNGETVVDVWGGAADQRKEIPWDEDTLCTVFSSTKGATALAAHTLVSAGALDLNAPVRRYWPEFATHGKEQATVRMMLDHSVGVPCLREPVKEGGVCDWDYMIDRLEKEEPFWKPGTRNGYHMINFGWTVGELIRRVSGQSLGAYFRNSIAEPVDAEFWIGLPEDKESKVAPVIPFRPDKDDPVGAFAQAILDDRHSLQALALFNQGGFNPNDRACHAAEIGGAGGIANGRGMARIYTPFACGGHLHGHEFVSGEALAKMTEVAVATNEDATLLIPSRFGFGFMKSMDNRGVEAVAKDSVILGPQAFGHVGAGGSIGFADPEAGMGFGYAMNLMGPGILLNQRGQGLVDAAYASLGYVSNASGVWRR